MSVLSDYTKQSIILKTKGAVNGANEATYTPNTIRGRLQYKRKLIRNTQGQEVVSEAQLFTEHAVSLDDRVTIDGADWPVLDVQKTVDLDGAVQWYEVML
jgi:hypothetical protein